MLEDISERHRAEAELSESEARFRNLFEEAPVGLVVCDEDAAVTSANPALASMLGYSSAELVGEPLRVFRDPSVPLENRNLSKQLLAGDRGSYQRDLPFRHKDGHRVWVRMTTTGLGSAGSTGFYRVLEDITEQRAQEEALRESEERLRVMVENMTDGVGVSRGGDRLFGNRALYELYGYSGEEEGITKPTWSEVAADDIVDEGDLDPPREYRARIVRADGTTRQAEVKTAPIIYGGVPARLSVVRDVTERERVAEDLRSSEERFRRLFEAAPVGIAVLDEADRIITANGRLESFLRYSPGELEGKAMQDLRDYSMPSQGGRGWERLISGEIDTFQIDRPLLRKDGTQVWLRITTGGLRRDREGRVTAYRIAEDITEERRAADELRESELRFRGLFESAPIGIAVVDDERRIHETNVAFRGMMSRMTGSEEGSYLDTTVGDLRMGQTPVRGEGQFPRLLSGEIDSYRRTRQFLHPSGSVSWADITTTAVRDEHGRFLYAMRMIEDITLRVHAVEGLRQSEAWNRALLNALPDLLLVIGRDGTYLDAVEGTPGMTPFPVSEFIGKTIQETFPSEFADFAMEHVERAFETGDVVNMEYDLPLPMSDGRIHSFEGRLVHSEEDEVVMIIRDITERKEIERMKEQFLSTISHELRTPLTAIRGAVGLASSGQLGELPERAKHLMGIANNNSERLAALVNDIMDMERMAAGVIGIDPEECDAPDIVQQALENVLVQANERNVTVHVATEDVELVADTRRMVQAITNLLGNAVKFSDEGSNVTLREFRQGDFLRIEVKDEGRGIPEEELSRIFDRFQQVDASDARVHGGAGLGLAIAKWVVDQHGGKIWAESEEGNGSTFIVELPLVGPQEAEADD